MPRTNLRRNSGEAVATAAGAMQEQTPPPPTDTPAPQQEQRSEQSAQDGREDAASREERIRRAAYDAYVRRGDGPGDAEQDWLQAEAQIDGRSR
ncbi:DUF2934 domain-containing protein [Variovorax atrisoli]|uniref:DUF2934 domain-containing protein n=2 Tax=Variovorax atrisoli TaxID=3394203 RepID=UPI0003A2EC7C|nr:DUF2934 domain-containing protein [Variovorax paradoxus]